MESPFALINFAVNLLEGKNSHENSRNNDFIDRGCLMKYLTIITEKLQIFKKGMEKNAKYWVSLPGIEAHVQLHINEVSAKNREIEQLRKELSLKYSEARALNVEKKEFINKLEKRAVGFHADDPEKLIEYGIKKSNSKSKIPDNREGKIFLINN